MPDDASATATAAMAAATTTTTTETAPASSAPTPYDWSKAGLAPEHLNLVTERGWKSPGDVMTSYRHLETATGVPPERLIKLPSAKDAADPKVWRDINLKLGMPESADKYVIPVPEGDKGEFANAVKPWLHEAGISQSAATKLATKWNEYTATQTKAQQTATEQRNLTEVTALKQGWGADYDKNAALVDKAAEQFGMTQAHLDAFKSAMGPKAAMEFLHNIGAKIATEDKSVPGMSGQQGSFAMTPEAAQAKITQLKGDRDFAKLFNSPDVKQRREARQEMDRLHMIAYPCQTPVGGSTARATK